MVEAGIAQLVAADAGVQALIGSPARFFPILVPDNPGYPCASYHVVSNTPSYTLAEGSPINSLRLQVDTWSGGAENASYADVKAVQAAIRKVLELFVGQLPDGTRVGGIFVSNAIDLYESDARCYRTSTDYLIHYYPA